MIALLEHQRIGRRPQGASPEVVRVRSWRSEGGSPGAATRPDRRPPRGTRRGSERLDELMRRQAPARSHDGTRRSTRPARQARLAPQARVRVERRGRLSMTVTAFGREAVEWTRENRRVLGIVAAGAAGLLALLVAVAEIPGALRAPAITLAASSSSDLVLLEGRLPADRPAEGIQAAVVRILRVRQHEVQAGETLSEIASRYGLRLGTVINFNGIADARSIPVGKKLSIPNADGLLYRVSRGDSLGRIARAYGVSANALMDWNDLQSTVIKPGDKLFVPGAKLSDDAINAVLGKLFIYPTRGELTSTFGNRMSPIYRQVIFHNGIDIHNRTGTPVVASRAGRVAGVEIHPVYGKTVLLAHTGGFQTMYAHLDTILVRRGQSVGQGEQIGAMGSTGSTTGPHLHFSIFRNSEPVDPLRLLH